MPFANRLGYICLSLLLVLTASSPALPAGASVTVDLNTPVPTGKIAFLRPLPPGNGSVNTDVWTMNVDGSDPTQLTTDLVENRQPAMSPDSSTIIYGARNADVLTLWTMESDGDNEVKLPIAGNSQAVTWAPDGSSIAYVNDSQDFWEVWIAEPNGAGAQRLTTHLGAAGMPSWSPDMQQLVYVVEVAARVHDVYTTTVTGSSALLVSASATGFSNHWPAWSPDGSEIATIHFAAGGSGPYDLWLMDSDGTNGRVLVEDIESPNSNRLSWSADGNWLVFAKNGKVWRVHRDGTEAFPVSDSSGWEPSARVSDFLPLNRLYVPLALRDYCSPLYADDFSATNTGWPNSDNGYVLWQYLTGEYRILVRPANAWAGAVPGFKAANGTYAVDVRNQTGVYGSYGILFGSSDDRSQFYTFEIDRDGYYVLYRYNSGSWTLRTVGSSGSINTGTNTNRLKVTRNGNLIRAYANGQQLAVVDDGTFTGLRRAGVIVSSYATPNVDVRFDNYHIYPLGCAAAAVSSSEWPSLSGEAVTGTGVSAPLADTTHPRRPLMELDD